MHRRSFLTVGVQISPGTEDEWLLWLPIAAVATVTALTFFCGLPGMVSFVLIPLSELGFLAGAIGLCVSAVALVAKERRRRAASVMAALLLPILLWGPITWAVQCLHLGLTVGFGAGQLGSRSTQAGVQFAVYDWSTGLAGGPNTFLIRDVSDEIALPLARHTHPAALENGFGEDCAGRVRHLLGHYYVCTF